MDNFSYVNISMFVNEKLVAVMELNDFDVVAKDDGYIALVDGNQEFIYNKAFLDEDGDCLFRIEEGNTIFILEFE